MISLSLLYSCAASVSVSVSVSVSAVCNQHAARRPSAEDNGRRCRVTEQAAKLIKRASEQTRPFRCSTPSQQGQSSTRYQPHLLINTWRCRSHSSAGHRVFVAANGAARWRSVSCLSIDHVTGPERVVEGARPIGGKCCRRPTRVHFRRAAGILHRPPSTYLVHDTAFRCR